MLKIAVVEDQQEVRDELCRFIRKYAAENSLQVEAVPIEDGAVIAAHYEPGWDIIFMDVEMPGMDGFEVLRELREQEHGETHLPVMLLTARAEDADQVRGLEGGADDYVTKPFSPKELVARIKAVMRRISPMAVEEVIEMQGLSLDPTSHRVMAGEEPLEMGPTEFKLLHFFMTHPERVYSREQLLNHVWGTNVYVEDRTVDVHIRRLRKALEPGGHDRMVQTVRGTGYRFSTRF